MKATASQRANSTSVEPANTGIRTPVFSPAIQNCGRNDSCTASLASVVLPNTIG